MFRSMLKVMAATAVFAGVHSLLASRAAKRVAAEQFGQRNRNGLYRLFYLGQSVVTFGILVAYIRRQPTKTIYVATGTAAAAMHAAQFAALVYAVRSANQVGILKMAGIESVRAWLGGDVHVPPEPEAQGPAMEDGRLRATGPFAGSRHPLNFAPIPIFWLWPRMTTRLLAFNIAATAYLYLGSIHEEMRLKAAYGDEYRRYLQANVPFYVPAGSSLDATQRLEGSNEF